jgi:hypothetical protein
LPVAKRNFSTRHHHGDLLEQSIREENGLVMRSEADEDLAKRRETVLREKRERVTSWCASSCCTSSSVASSIYILSEDTDESDDGRSSSSKKRVKRQKTGTKKREKEETNGDAAADGLETYSRNYHEQWMKLLAERPRQGDMNEWLDKVLALSEKMSSNPPLRAQVEYLHETNASDSSCNCMKE